jgi:L-glutamine:2-deoxy-scyllo-inosose/3-amino-2,3-dideoxy-scyllo-inosose aminotransferase
MKLALLGGTPTNRAPWPKWPRLGSRGSDYVRQVLESERWSISGPRTNALTMNELSAQRFAEYCGTKFAFAVDHGSSALVAALLALDVSPGDEVVIPGMTWVACATAVLRVNAVPVFADICEKTLCIDPDAIEAAITPRTKAIMIVHLYSSMADLDRISDISRRRGIALIEDCAQSHGAEWGGKRAGATGAIGAFSFHQGKPLATGEGGMVVTSDEKLAHRLEQIRADGRRYGAGRAGHQHLADVADVQGFNFCMSEVHCALLMDALDRIEEENAHRARNAMALDEYLSASRGWLPVEAHPKNGKRTYYHYAVRFDPELFKNCTPEVVCAALEAELCYHVHPSYPPMNKFKLFAPDRCSSLRGVPWARSLKVDGCRLPVADEQHRRLVLLHHPILLCEPDRIALIAEAFRKVSRLAADLTAGGSTAGGPISF